MDCYCCVKMYGLLLLRQNVWIAIAASNCMNCYCCVKMYGLLLLRQNVWIAIAASSCMDCYCCVKIPPIQAPNFSSQCKVHNLTYNLYSGYNIAKLHKSKHLYALSFYFCKIHLFHQCLQKGYLNRLATHFSRGEECMELYIRSV